MLSRKACFDILKLVIDQKMTTDIAFEKTDTLKKLTGADYQFARLLVLTTLRRYGQARALLAPFLTKPISAKNKDIELVLIISIVQLYFLKTAPYAVLDTAGKLTKNIKQTAFVPFVNGVLRNFVRRGLDLPEPDVSLNLPDWLFTSFKKMFGKKTAIEFCNAFLTPPTLDITAKNNPELWAKKLNGVLLPTGTIRTNFDIPVTQLPGYETGDWWVQEASASIPAQLFDDLKGKQVADLCSAPGGKTAQLLARGAFVDAYDISQNRLNRVYENMTRLNLSDKVTLQCKNALEINKFNHYDAVLLDAPCSATGTIKRHPDLCFHRTLDDITRLADLQKQLLQKAITLTKPGGQIVYSTCSLQNTENENVIFEVLSTHPNITRTPIKNPAFTPYLTKKGALQPLPNMNQDGFFAVLLTKK